MNQYIGNVNWGRKVPEFIKASLALFVAGLVCDFLINPIVDIIPVEGAFSAGILLGKHMFQFLAPGIEDVWKILLDLFYAAIWTMLPKK